MPEPSENCQSFRAGVTDGVLIVWPVETCQIIGAHVVLGRIGFYRGSVVVNMAIIG